MQTHNCLPPEPMCSTASHTDSRLGNTTIQIMIKCQKGQHCLLVHRDQKVLERFSNCSLPSSFELTKYFQNTVNILNSSDMWDTVQNALYGVPHLNFKRCYSVLQMI